MNASRAQQLAGRYNMAVNLFWSALCLVPLCWYWSIAFNTTWLIVAIVISMAALFPRQAFFNKMQLSRSTLLYRRLGVPFMQQFAQNGNFVNRQVQRTFPGHRVVHNRKSIRHYRERMLMFEKFHFLMLVFFLVTTIYAAVREMWWWVAIITLSNVIYNGYPLLLQQYNRLRHSVV